MFTTLRLRRAQAKYDSNPEPERAVQVVKLLLKAGRGSEALQAAKDAKGLFPTSPEVAQSYFTVRRFQAKVALKMARRRLRQQPKVENYLRIADLERTLGRFGKAQKVLQQAERRFPKYWGVHFARGKLAFSLFKESRKASDSSTCLEALRRALELNPSNYQLLIYFAVVTGQLGLYVDASQAIETILGSRPDDPKALDIQQWIERARAEEAEALTGLQEAEPVEADADTTTRTSTEGELAGPLAGLQTIQDLAGIYAFDGEGTPVFSRTKPSTEFEFTDAVDTIRSIVSECRFDASNLGLGELRSCAITGDTWQIFVRAADESHVVLLRDHSQSDAPICDDVDNVLVADYT